MIKRFMKHAPDESSSSGALNDLSFLLIIFFARPNLRNWMKCVLKLRKRPIPKMHTIAGMPHTILLMAELILAIVSIISPYSSP